MTEHHYHTRLSWQGNTGNGYRAYDRAHRVEAAGVTLNLSADPAFRGDGELPNPEQLLVAAASSCQLLSFLALASIERVEVLEYSDDAKAVMREVDGVTKIDAIDLHLILTVRGQDEQQVLHLLEKAHEQCYIANSLTADVTLHPVVTVIA